MIVRVVVCLMILSLYAAKAGTFGWCQEPTTAKPAEWIELFNGKNLTDWVPEGKIEFKDKETGKLTPNWSAREGVIRCEGYGFGFLRYNKQKFADFELQLEYRMLPRGKSMGNSGIGIRVLPYDPKRDEQTRPSLSAYEVQLLDDAGQQPNKYSSGSLYRYVAPKLIAVKPAPEWNSVTIRCVGPLITIVFNGTEVLSVDQSTIQEIRDKPLEGYICVQCHDTPIEFRNLKARVLKE